MDAYFQSWHERFRDGFDKDTFFRFYSALKNEIMKATDFRPTADTTDALLTALKTRNIEDYYRAFDHAMREIFEFSPELYVSLCKYLERESTKLSDDEYVLLEFYAWLELERKTSPFSNDIEGKLKFILDDQFTQCDDAIEEYFNAEQSIFEAYFEKYADVDVPELYGELIHVTVQEGNYRRAFVYLARALFIADGICFYRDQHGRIRDYKPRREVSAYAETR